MMRSWSVSCCRRLLLPLSPSSSPLLILSKSSLQHYMAIVVTSVSDAAGERGFSTGEQKEGRHEGVQAIIPFRDSLASKQQTGGRASTRSLLLLSGSYERDLTQKPPVAAAAAAAATRTSRRTTVILKRVNYVVGYYGSASAVVLLS